MSLLRSVWVISFAAAVAASAEPATYEIQPADGTYFELRVYKTGLMSGKQHLFRFEHFQGNLNFDPAAPHNSSARFTVDSNSIICLDDWVSEKDRRKILEEARGNMLAVEKHPHLTFESASFRASGEGVYQVVGRLTIRDQTREVPVEVTVRPEGDALAVEGKAVVSLKDYGLDPPSAALGLIGTKSEMDVSFALRATPAKD